MSGPDLNLPSILSFFSLFFFSPLNYPPVFFFSPPAGSGGERADVGRGRRPPRALPGQPASPHRGQVGGCHDARRELRTVLRLVQLCEVRGQAFEAAIRG